MSTNRSTCSNVYDSCDDEKDIMERNWKRNISDIEKVLINKLTSDVC